jgi:hypothetical protein
MELNTNIIVKLNNCWNISPILELWPAIDLIGSTSVRLTEGKYDSEEKMSRSAEESPQ